MTSTMESFWQKEKSLAEDATRISQALTSSPVRIADIVSETAKRSKDIAAEASKKADEFKTAALLSLADQIPSLSITSSSSSSDTPSESELENFGIIQDLWDFVKGLTLLTFQSFPFPDDLVSDVATVSNVRQDLSEWQQNHANLVLATIKEVSKLRYDLCPRHMKDGRLWRIYFTLVSTHASPYVTAYILKKVPRFLEQDLDSYLLGDFDDSEGHSDDENNDAFDGVDDDDDDDDDFDKIENSEIEDEK
ncbi:hypothetical protein L2E82_45405 [Cichorium intybus]|uniref:Uncharacterized protein n=1 Tax=Cichorium intybus TaxID=13427 RepID=A0ACB8ZT77_CICIN|nr:hypothetical protein L2E82_45405 [Cichorium intybus]